MAETTKTFLELIKDYKIIIPLIQRDYAQGREKEINKAGKFLKAIKNGCASKLNLDFVYGKRDEENKIFIPLDGQQRLTTLFLIHWYLSLENDYKFELSNFSYEVRSSSKDFLEELTKNKNWKIFSRKNIKTQVENSNWFFMSWKNDLTVVSLLNMLDLIEKFFENEDINNLNNITFEILYLDEFKLTDELYVKMNARGKPLTLFENFKAEFESYIEKTGDSKEVIAKNKASFDNEWLNIFWNLAKKKVEEKQINIDEAPKLADEMFYNFFYNSTFNLFLAKQDKILKINNEEYSTINNFIEENDIFSFYKQTFDDTNTIGIIKVLNNLKVDEIFETFVNNIDKITQWDRAKFYALYLGYICDLDENEFGRWKRVSFNLINNQLIQSPDDLIKTIQSLNNLIEQSNKDIYGYIKDNYEVIHYFSTIQRKEESLKVNLISNDENWEKELIEAEQHFYLDGQIKFLIDFSNKELETFKIYRTKFLNLWKLTKYKSNIIQRALLAEYDYTCLNSREYIGKYSLCSFGTGLREKNENWRKVFKENDFKLFLDNLNLYDLENSLIKIINKYKFDCKDWKSFIINPKYEWDIINKIRNGHFQIKNENNIFLNDGDTLSTSWSWSRVAELKSYYTFMYLINNSFQENIKKILNQDITLNYYSSSETEDICFYFIIKHNDNNLGIDIKFDTLKNKYLFRTYCIKPYQDLEEIELNFDLYSVKKINDFIQLEEEIISKINNFNKNNLYKI